MHVLWNCSQMSRIQAPVCSTFLWICDVATRCQSAISRFLRGSGDLAQRLWCEGFMRRHQGKPQWQFVDAGPCKCGASTEVLTGEVQFCPGAGRDGCPLHRPSRGRGSKACPESHVGPQNTWKHTHTEGLRRDLNIGTLLEQNWNKTFMLLDLCCFIANKHYNSECDEKDMLPNYSYSLLLLICK